MRPASAAFRIDPKMATRLVFPLLLAGMVWLAGCSGRLTPEELGALDGIWSGVATLRDGPRTRCPASTRYRLTVRHGTVEGEAVDVRSPETIAKFQSYLDIEGRLIADAYVGGDRLEIKGQFTRSSFSGTSTSRRDCFMRIQLTHASASR